MEYKFGFKEPMIKDLINTLNYGLDRSKQSANETIGFENGLGMGKYRYIYYSMMHLIPVGLVPIKLKINSWDYVAYYHSESETLFGLISKTNFDYKRSNPPEILHYMAAKSEFFNIQQNNFEDLLSESQKAELQLNFDLGEDEQVLKVIDSIFGGIDFDLEKVEKFVLLVADFMHDEVVGLQAKIINKNFDILYSEDWSEYIILSANNENDEENKFEETQQHGIKLRLKQKDMYKNDNGDN